MNAKYYTTFSLIALVISVISLGVTMFIFYETKRINRYQLNIGLQYEAEKMFKDNECLMMLHGIDPQEIKNDSINMEEFYYIFSSFRASEAYYIINDNSGRISKFRTHFLSNPKVELVYSKYLRNKLISTPVFINLVDKYYEDKNAPTYYKPK